MITALAGGVGAARFLKGLLGVVPPESVAVVVNTADDEEFFGLHVSPDLDTVTYTLAGAENTEMGWGLKDESFNCLEAISRFGGPTWFRLGDRDLATHLFRTERLREGMSLSAVSAEIAEAWRLKCRILPMSDDRVRTKLTLKDGRELPMQEWFVKERSEPRVQSVYFEGASSARPAAGVLEAIEEATTILICPSNPIISIGPILAIKEIRDALTIRRDRVVGVSPIIAGKAVKGPAATLMADLGMKSSCVGVADAYSEICSTIVIDQQDAESADEITRLGLRPVVADTVMRNARVAAALARHTLDAVA